MTRRKKVRDRAREVLEVGPDEAADDDWRWLLEAMAKDNLSLLSRVEQLEGVTPMSFSECVRELMRSRGTKSQRELVGRLRAAGMEVTEQSLSKILGRQIRVPRKFFETLAEALELRTEEKVQVAWAYVWGD
jgi:hypothetical protein